MEQQEEDRSHLFETTPTHRSTTHIPITNARYNNYGAIPINNDAITQPQTTTDIIHTNLEGGTAHTKQTNNTTNAFGLMRHHNKDVPSIIGGGQTSHAAAAIAASDILLKSTHNIHTCIDIDIDIDIDTDTDDHQQEQTSTPNPSATTSDATTGINEDNSRCDNTEETKPIESTSQLTMPPTEAWFTDLTADNHFLTQKRDIERWNKHLGRPPPPQTSSRDDRRISSANDKAKYINNNNNNNNNNNMECQQQDVGQNVTDSDDHEEFCDTISHEQQSETPPISTHDSCGSQGSILTEVRQNSFSHQKLNELDNNNNVIIEPPHSHKFNTQANIPSSPDSYYQQRAYAEYPAPAIIPPPPKQDPTVNAQAFVLAIAFFCIWSPQNLMAPNLTQMMHDFSFTKEQRDIFLGANIAFATGVLSLPVSALLGFYADFVQSRKMLFAYTVLGGGMASICTGCSTSYAQLYFARFLCGGFMSGSVPIAFSMLGDLFDATDRNAASSGLTAMMGAGILFGQVFAGTVGARYGWQLPFIWSGMLSIVTSFMVMVYVREPVRGGKEKVLQDMIATGTKYERTLTLDGFVHAMTKNKTNVILMVQGFTTNLPWGIIFTFLNDYLSQEQGLSVPASTFLVFWFGVGSAFGGVLGGYFGAEATKVNRALLPLFMALSTLLGILPFLGLLDLNINGPSLLAIFCSFSGGCIANLPSVNVRPCLLNVNPPETRGAAMTAANLMINVARGAGPSLLIFSQALFGVSRQYSFNVTIIIFWCISTVLLLILAGTLPADQDAMDADLALYAKFKMSGSSIEGNGNNNSRNSCNQDIDNGETDDEFFSLTASVRSMSFDDIVDNVTRNEEASLMSIEDRMQSFDATAANESMKFIGNALREIGAEFNHFRRNTSNRSSIRLVNDEVIVTTDRNQDVVWDSEGGGGYLSGTGLLNNDSLFGRRGPDIDLDRGKHDNVQSGLTEL